MTHVQALTRAPTLGRVRLVTTPPGASVRRLDADEGVPGNRTYTPAELFIEVNRPQRFVLTMPGYLPLEVEARVPPGEGTLEQGGALVPGADLRIEANCAGTVSVSNAPHCSNISVPAVCTLAPGTYELAFTTATHERVNRTVELHDTDDVVRFEIAQP